MTDEPDLDDDDEGLAAPPVDERVELAAFLGDELSRTRCAQAGKKLPAVENQLGDWLTGLCTLARRWPPEVARQATGRAALVMARIAVQSAGAEDKRLAGDAPARLLAAAQQALVADRQAAHRSIAELLKADLLSIPEPGKRLRGAALLAFQQALAGATDGAALGAIADTFMKTAGAEDRKSAWRALKDELRSSLIPWALGRGDPLAR